MTDYTQTVVNYLDVQGQDSANLWNSVTWNSFKWASVQDIIVLVEKPLANSITGSMSLTFDIAKLISESQASDTSVFSSLGRTIGLALTASGDLSSQVLEDSDGWTYNFPSGADDGEERDFTTWTEATAQSSTWTSGTAQTTTWSEA